MLIEYTTKFSRKDPSNIKTQKIIQFVLNISKRLVASSIHQLRRRYIRKLASNKTQSKNM